MHLECRRQLLRASDGRAVTNAWSRYTVGPPPLQLPCGTTTDESGGAVPGGWEILIILFILGLMFAVIVGAVFVGCRLANRKRPPSDQ